MTSSKFIFFIIASTLSMVSHAKTLSLHDAILLALRQNPTVKSAKIDSVIQQYQLDLVKDTYAWHYALDGHENYTRTTLKNSQQSLNYGQLEPNAKVKTPFGGEFHVGAANTLNEGKARSQAVFVLTQPLLRGAGKKIAQRELRDALNDDEINKIRIQQTVMDTITNVIIAYHQLLVDRQNILIQKHSLKDVEKTIWVNKEKIKAGKLEKTANVQQQVQRQEIQINIERAKNTEKEDRQHLMLLLGLNDNQSLNLNYRVTLNKKPYREKEAVRVALIHNSQYQMELIALQKHQRALYVARNDLLPQLDLSAKATVGRAADLQDEHLASDVLDYHYHDEEIGLSLHLPIRERSDKLRLLTMRQQLEKDRIQLRAHKFDLIAKVKQQVRQIDSLLEQYHLSIKQVALAKKAYNLERQKRDVGRASSLDVTTSQNHYIRAKQSLIETKINYLNAIALFEDLLGVGLERWGIVLSS